MKREISRKRPNRYQLFVIVSMIGIISFFFYALFAGAAAFDWLCIDNFGGGAGVTLSVLYGCIEHQKPVAGI